jgi:hypothetical protein
VSVREERLGGSAPEWGFRGWEGRARRWDE